VALDVSLTANDLFDWPVRHARLPYGFDADIYLWLHPDVARSGVDPAVHYARHGKDQARTVRYHRLLELNRLANKYKTDKGSLYYNRHFYARVYEHYLQELKNETFTLFEIGLRRDLQARNPAGPFTEAPSLRMWAEYFPNAQIHGFDIQDFSSVEGGRIVFTQGDQSDRDALTSALAKIAYPLRVIIDDGSHASHDQQIALGHLFRQLAPGGFYFIEVLHYQPPEWERPGAKKTADFLHDFAAGRAMANHFVSAEDLAYLCENAAAVQFHDSMDYQAATVGAGCPRCDTEAAPRGDAQEPTLRQPGQN
jgi:hypothetical protein